MTTEVNTVLPIPEQVVVGSGMYVIPANRYGYLHANTTVAGRAGTSAQGTASGSASGSASANSAGQWVTEGDTVTSLFLLPSTSGALQVSPGSVGPVLSEGFTGIYLNGTAFCISYASVSSHFYGSTTVDYSYTFGGNYAWSVSLFRIPKANLPTGTAEGE
jgi:hypothetical protein